MISDLISEWNMKIDHTWIGLAAISKPATPPPMTRPSGPASETLNPPFRLLMPLPLSLTVNEPDKDRISKRP